MNGPIKACTGSQYPLPSMPDWETLRFVLPRAFMLCVLHRVIQFPRIGFYMFPRAVTPGAFSVVPPRLLYLLFNLGTTIHLFQGIATLFNPYFVPGMKLEGAI